MPQMVFIAATHEYEAELDKKLIRERRMAVGSSSFVYPTF